MVLERSNQGDLNDQAAAGNDERLDESSRQILRDEIIVINPILLLQDEMQYELVLRALSTAGRHRDKTGRLRPILEAERRNNVFPKESHVALRKDTEECQAKLKEVAQTLQLRTLDTNQMHRTATLCAHLEMRVGRMYPQSPTEDETVREMRQMVDFYINEYLNKLQEMATRTGARSRPPTQQNANVTVTPVEPLIDLTENNSPLTNRTNVRDGNGFSQIDQTFAMPVLNMSDGNDRTGQDRSRMEAVRNAKVNARSTWVQGGTTYNSAHLAQITLPTEANWTGVPMANSLTQSQERALNRVYDSGLEGESFVQNFSNCRSDGPRNVRFSLGSHSDRGEVSRTIFDTPHPRGNVIYPNVLAPNDGRHSDASNKTMQSGASGFSAGMTSRSDSHSTRMPEQFDANVHASCGPRNDQLRPPVNQTYVINDGNGNRAPEGQWIYVPGNSSGRRDQQPSMMDSGEWVFIPYEEPNAWKSILGNAEARDVHSQNERRPISNVAPAVHERTWASTFAAPNSGNDHEHHGVSDPGVMNSTYPNYSNLSTNAPQRTSHPGGFPNYQPRLKPLPVHLWKISFSGEEKPSESTDLKVNEFLYQVEVNKRAQRISDEEMLGQVSSLLNGTARTWYYAYFNSFTSWPSFVRSLRVRFLSPYHEQDALDEISRRVQKKNESALAYLNHMVMLFQTVAHGMDEGRMVHIIRRNLRPEIQTQVGPWEPRTLAHLERILSLLQTSRVQAVPEPEKKVFVRRWPRKVEAIESQGDEDDYEFSEDEVLALMRETFFRKNRNGSNAATDTTRTTRPQTSSHTNVTEGERSKRKLADCVCFNCQEKGHLHRECKQPLKGIFCHLCGKEGVKTFQCDCPKNGAASLDLETEKTDDQPGNDNN